MEVIEHRVRYRSRKDVFQIYPLGDIHAGTKHCAEEEIKSKVKEIKDDPFALWIGMGDYGEFITPGDNRWDYEVISDWVERSNVAESQRVWLRHLLKPIADKCIGLLEGNHEVSVRQHNYQDVYLDLCRDLEVKPLGYSCFVKFHFNRGALPKHKTTSFTGVFQHGSGGAQTEGGQIMRLKKLMDSFVADIYAMGHLHTVKVNTIPVLTLTEGLKIKDRVKVGAITGSWFRTYSQGVRASYAEMKGYSPSVLGCPHFVIIPDKGILKVIG